MNKIRKKKTICFIIVLVLAIFSVFPLLAQGTSLSVQVSANPSSGPAPLNGVDFSFDISGTATGDIVYKIDCTSDSVLEKVETTASDSFVAQDVCDYPDTGDYLATIEVLREGLHYQTTLPIVVAEAPALSVQASASPSSGEAPLNDVDISISVSGTATGTINYKIDCTNDGIWEREISSDSTTYTASDLCDYTTAGIYSIKIKVERQGLAYETTLPINVASAPGGGNGGGGGGYPCPSVSVNIKAQGVDGPITIPYNESVKLTWTSVDATSCVASNDWSGSKATSGSEETGNLISSKVYTLTCTIFCSSDSKSDKVEVNVAPPGSPVLPALEVEKLAQNLSKGSSFSNSVEADPAELISFQIKITATGALDNVTVEDALPEKIIYQGNLKIDDASSAGDIISGLDLGNFSPGQTKTITFDTKLAEPSEFGFGQTILTNTASVSSSNANISNTGSAEIIVTKKEVAGAATAISTGWTNNIFLDTFFLPLIIALIATWLLRSHIINFEEWLDSRKKVYQGYQSEKFFKELLKKKICIR